LIYRPSQLSDPKKTVERWREHFSSVGLGNPYIAAVQARETLPAEEYGMDAAVGFPPFWRLAEIPWQQGIELLDRKFYGAVRRYEDLAKSTIAGYRDEGHVFPGIVPSWDNDARRPRRGGMFFGVDTGDIWPLATGRLRHRFAEIFRRRASGVPECLERMGRRRISRA
jgi:hypothetical protein